MTTSPSTTSTLPDLKIDRCLIGFTGAFRGVSLPSPSELATRFAPFATLTTPASRRSDRYFQLTVPLCAEEDETEVGQLYADLHFKVERDALVLTNRSAIDLNPQKIERSILGEEVCGPLSFDGKSNVLGPQHRGPEVLARLLEIVHDAVAYLLDMLVEVLPEADWQPGEIWLKASEACRNHEVEDALAAVRALQWTTLAGASATIRDSYRISSMDAGRLVSMRWIDDAGGPEHKTYGKRRKTLRAEVACPRRPAIGLLCGRTKLPLSPASAVALLTDFVRAAEPGLSRIESHIQQALAGGPTILDLVQQLHPLTALSLGECRGRGPAPSQTSIIAARDALDALLTTGAFSAVGIPAEHAIRRVLEELCRNDGPLLRSGRRVIYFLHPRFARPVADQQ